LILSEPNYLYIYLIYVIKNFEVIVLIIIKQQKGADNLNFQYEVELAIKGNGGSFARIINDMEGSMYRVAKSILQGDNDCADAIQETILKAYKSINSLRQPQFFKTWLIRILINECKRINIQKNKIIPMEEIIPDISFRDTEDNALLHEIINLLENDLRTVVLLYYFEDLPVKEISDILDIPEGTVKSKLSRARKKLANILNDNLKEGCTYERKSI
jgi:RNA polymerase sigma-70 factor (ECF subfamily)